jgi:hypothetical protein
MCEYHELIESSKASILFREHSFPKSIYKHLTLICMFVAGTNGSWSI